MATKTTKKPKRAVQKSRVVTSNKKRKPSKLRRLLSSKTGMLVAGVVIGGVGAYLLASSNADVPLPDNNPSRGLYYSSIGEKKVTNGPCKDDLEDTTKGQTGNSKACTHADPGPEGVDVRERAKKLDALLATQAEYDRQHPAKPAGDPTNPPPITSTSTANDLSYQGSLSQISGNTWPCADTGTGPRIATVYVYKSGNSNRRDTYRDTFEGIARRTNAVMYNSSVASGAPRQYKFKHYTDCSSLWLPAVSVTGDISSYGNIVNQLRAKGYNDTTVKYLVWVDSTSGCGTAGVRFDTQPGQANANNSGNSFALVWRSCWNYAEPHELMHALGAVETGAPYATSGHHCYDQHDVMCYNDGTHSMSQVCTSSVYIWRYDCKYNTYFNSGTPAAGSYLATHWNTANSAFLTHY